jgi:uncharacterized membrane-anchored protein
VEKLYSSDVVRLVLGAFFIGNAIYGIYRGSASVVYQSVDRKNSPIFFWIMTVFSFSLGVALLLFSI